MADDWMNKLHSASVASAEDAAIALVDITPPNDAQTIATLRAENLKILREWTEQTEFLKKECYGLTVDNSVLRADLAKVVEGLEWIEKTCREEIPLEYNDGMRKVFQRNIRDAALSLIKELRP